MKRMIVGFIFAAMQVLPAATAQEPNLALQLIFTPNHIAVMPESDIELSIEWVNNSDHILNCSTGWLTGGINEWFTYDVRRSDGKALQRRDRGLPQYEPSPPPCCLNPGTSGLLEVGPLVKAFDMQQPGVYTVRLSRPDLNHLGRLLGTSNILTITVMAH
jgi:hypothetical protein